MAGSLAEAGRDRRLRASRSILPAVLRFAGLAVTTDHYLIVGTLQPNGLLIFDLRGGGSPLALEWPAGSPFAPFDISASADGGAWILDRDAHALWRLNRQFKVVWAAAPSTAAPAVAFAPLGAAAADLPPLVPISEQAALILGEAKAPIAVEALADGSVLVLDDSPTAACSVVHRYRLDGRISRWPSTRRSIRPRALTRRRCRAARRVARPRPRLRARRTARPFEAGRCLSPATWESGVRILLARARRTRSRSPLNRSICRCGASPERRWLRRSTRSTTTSTNDGFPWVMLTPRFVRRDITLPAGPAGGVRTARRCAASGTAC